MDPSNGSYGTLLICGNQTKITRKFNEQTTIEQVCEYVSQSFDTSLPTSYRIVYYDPTTMSFVNLEHQLQNGFNPFQLNSSMGVRNRTDRIYLYVVSNSHSQNESEDDQIVSDEIDDEIRTESNISEHSLSTNDDISQDLSTVNEGITIIPQSIKLRETKNVSTRLAFSLDVKPNQRDIYKSDQFSIRTQKANGRIARIQGIKRDDQKMLQVLPRLRIPPINFQSNTTLLVAVVSEELKNGMRIWYRHPHKGFLPEGYTKDTKTINPMQIHLDKNNLTIDGDLTLSLQMVTKWNKSKKEQEEFYRYDDQRTVLIHPAKHDSQSPRLFCVLQEDGVTDWNTFCLSDFIRTPKPVKKRSPSVTTGKTCSPKRKRSKLND